MSICYNANKKKHKYAMLFEQFLNRNNLENNTIGEVIDEYASNLKGSISPEALIEKIGASTVVFITGNKVDSYEDIDPKVDEKNSEICKKFEEIGVNEIYNTIGIWKEPDWERPSVEKSLAVIIPDELFEEGVVTAINLGEKYNQSAIIIAHKGSIILYNMKDNKDVKSIQDIVPGPVFTSSNMLHREDDAPIGYTICGEGEDAGAIEFVE